MKNDDDEHCEYLDRWATDDAWRRQQTWEDMKFWALVLAFLAVAATVLWSIIS
jgi:anti-sigma-K factor RskA